MTEETPFNIYQRINAVMGKIDYVKKDAVIDNKYQAVTHDAVVALVRKEMVKVGIVVRLEQKKAKILQLRELKADIKQHFYSGVYDVHFVNIDKPQDFMTVTVNAHACDTQDKAPGKAASYAVKYAMLKTFSIETGENEEGRYHEADPYTPEQAAEFHELFASENAYEFYTFMATLPGDTAIALFNTFPEGKKTEGKKQARKLEAEGKELFEGIVDDINNRLDNHDISVLELTDEMDPMQKRLLMSRLSKPAIAQLAKIKEASI